MDLRRAHANQSGLKVPPTVTSALVAAVLEWMLIFMLFVDASFSYFITRFASYCQLPIPCLLCSRLDHVLGNERDGFYWDLICHKHKLKMSSSIFCELHDNVVDVRGACESCFFSFAKRNKSNAETYRVLVGKIGDEPQCHPSQGASSDEHKVGSSRSRKCMYCNEQFISETCSQKLFYSKSCDSVGAEISAPSSFSSKCNVDKVHEIVQGSSQRDQRGNQDAGLLPHLEYTKIEVTSNSDSERPFSDNGSGNVFIHKHETDTSGQDSATNYIPPEPQVITLAGYLDTEDSIHSASPIKFSLSESEDPSNFGLIVESEKPLGLGELNWTSNSDNVVSEPSECISFCKELSSPNINGTHHVESKEISVTSRTQLEKEVHVECGEASNLGKDFPGTTEFCKEVNMRCGETFKVGGDFIPENETHIDCKFDKTNTSSQMAESLDLGDAYKLAVGTRGRQFSGRFLEQQRSMTESTRASEDLKLLLSQLSAVRGIELPLNDMSPRVSANSEDLKAMDGSTTLGMQIIQRRISIERNESSLSFDGRIISDIDGESVEDCLKRQFDHDKKIVSTLYKELEEERNASAIAANQAMAMITRLQEEKAALNMEALQCLRMMEEQADYDSEALQKANDLLADKEKQIQDFEHELELYRNQFGDILLSNAIVKPRPESNAGGSRVQNIQSNYQESKMTACSISDNDKHDIVNKIDGAPKNLERDMNTGRISLPQFEDEKQFILHCLKTLEEKLSMFAKHIVYPDVSDGVFSTGEAFQVSTSNQPCCIGASEENGGTEKIHLPRDKVICREAPPNDLSNHENSQHENKGYHVSRDTELDALRHQLSVMKNRLEALEAEQNVIECSITSLEKGSAGFELVQEIAVWVQELHSAHIRSREELR